MSASVSDGDVSAHDPLCLASGRPSAWEPEMCICDVIAQVRENERREALGIRVREVMPYASGYIEGEDHMLAKCIAAIESLGSDMANWSSDETTNATVVFPDLTAEQWIWAQRGVSRSTQALRALQEKP